jgi:hypothetical protein
MGRWVPCRPFYRPLDILEEIIHQPLTFRPLNMNCEPIEAEMTEFIGEDGFVCGVEIVPAIGNPFILGRPQGGIARNVPREASYFQDKPQAAPRESALPGAAAGSLD